MNKSIIFSIKVYQKFHNQNSYFIVQRLIKLKWNVSNDKLVHILKNEGKHSNRMNR